MTAQCPVDSSDTACILVEYVVAHHPDDVSDAILKRDAFVAARIWFCDECGNALDICENSPQPISGRNVCINCIAGVTQ